MKKIFLIVYLIIYNLSFSQSEKVVEKLLIEKYTPKDSTIICGSWAFNRDIIHRFALPLITSKLKSIEFYKTNFSFIGGMEGWSEDCLVLFDKKSKEVIMLPQSSIERAFFKKFIGIQFINNSEIKTFANEFNSILLNKDYDREEYRVLKSLSVNKNIIKFEIRLSHQTETHDIVEILLKNNKIIEICRLSADWKNVEISIKQ